MPDDPSSPESQSLDLRGYIDVLLRRWKVVALVAASALVVAVGLSLAQDKQYVASAQVLVGQQSSETALYDSNAAYVLALNATRTLNNEVEALKSGLTRDAIAAEYDGPLDPDDVSVVVASATADVAQFSVKGPDPDEAAELVNTYVEVATRLRRDERTTTLMDARAEIQTRVDDLNGRIESIRAPLTTVEEQLARNPGNGALEDRRNDLTQSLAPRLNPLQAQMSAYQQQLENLQVSAGIAQLAGSSVLTPAEIPTEPVSPKPVQNGVLALFAGILIGVVVAFVLDALDERIREMSDLERAAPGIVTLTAVPEMRGPHLEHYLPVRDDASGMAAEAFRSLRTSVKFAGLDRAIRVIQVSSALPGEGKTTTAANLAAAFAAGGERVAVVCCDLRRPRIHKRFGQTLSPGFTDVLLRDVSLADGLRRVTENLYLLPAGSPPPNPSELLSSGRAQAVIDALAAEFDIVVIDSTPVLPVTDALVVSRLVDSTIVVVDVRTTKRKVLRQALQRLEQVGATITGLTLNGVGANDSYTYGYGYGYGYESELGRDSREPIGTSSEPL